MKFLKIAAAMLFSTAITAHAATPELFDSFTDEQIIEVLENDGYSNVEQVEEGLVLVEIDGDKYLIFNDNMDGDLYTYYGLSDVDVSYKAINEWNRDYRLSRAYIDEENDPVIESDLLGNAGMTKEQLSEFFDVFVGSVEFFNEFLEENEK